MNNAATLPNGYDEWVKQGDEARTEPKIEVLTAQDIDEMPEPLRELMRELANTLDNPHSCP
jgi:hypothetical protein